MDISILNTVKLSLGITTDDTSFDEQLLNHINSAFAKFHQIGVGPDKKFTVKDSTTTWDDYMEDSYLRSMIIELLGKEVRMKFDTPTSNALSTALQEQINELTYRINTEAEIGSDSK